VDDQVSAFTTKSLSWYQGTPPERLAISELMTASLNDLELRGFAQASSPYRLTPRGQTARLTGLSAPSVTRLESAVDRGTKGWLLDLVGQSRLTKEMAEQVARLLFEGIEVAEKSLWFGKNYSNDRVKIEALLKLADGEQDFVLATDEYENDIQIMSAWILGMSYSEIAQLAPIYASSNTLFGGTDDSKRTSDVTRYINRLIYPAGWVWAGVRVLAGTLGESLPTFIRSSVEFGLPSESAIRLVRNAGLTRSASMALVNAAGDSWDAITQWLSTDVEEQVQTLEVTKLDADRIVSYAHELF
jgi:hypothetical protein